MLTDYEISSKYLGNIILGWELIKLPIKSEGNKQTKVQPPPQKKQPETFPTIQGLREFTFLWSAY